MFHVFAALAEFERDLIRERTMAGLEAARARGRTGGRPTVWTADKVTVARDMFDSREHDVATIARVVGVSGASVYRMLSDTRALRRWWKPPSQSQPPGRRTTPTNRH